MRWIGWQNIAAGAAKLTRQERRAAAIAGGAHALHDGYTDLIYIMLPLWQAEFALSYAALGLLRSMFAGAMAGLQIPAGLLSERFGAAAVLAAGTALAGFGYCIAGLSTGFAMLLGALVIGGAGASTQHPIASALVARAFAGPRSLTALGTYNFSGDLGKVAVPAAVALALPWLGWRRAVEVYAVVGLLAAAAILALLGRLGAGRAEAPAPASAVAAPRTAGWGIRDPRAYRALSAIHVIDNSTRTGFLTFLPFLLIAKGATVPSVGLALMLVFIGGAIGKFACGALADRVGVIRTVVITEAATGVGILLLLTLPLGACLLALPPLGIVLNGTSSVLYGTVADLVSSDRRARSYAIFYTLGIGASALSPFAYGLLSDWGGVRLTLTVVGLVVFLTLPFTLPLRPPSPAAAAHSA